VEEVKWDKAENPLIPAHLELTHKIEVDSFKMGDEVQVEFFYPNGQKAVEGIMRIDKGKRRTKLGSWNFYYQNGKPWSTREYKGGRLTKIVELKAPDGTDLPLGFARFTGKKSRLIGNQYIYNEKGEVDSIAYYRGSKIEMKYAGDEYTDDQLGRIKVRTFETSSGDILEELSFEEAYELQKNDGRTILLNATTSWNGYSRKGFKSLFGKPEIAQYIQDNFILAYLDIEDTKTIEINLMGEDQVFEGSKGRGRFHGVIDKLSNGRGIRNTPTFYFIGPEMQVLHTHKGIEMGEEDFMKSLDLFVSGAYKTQTWKEFSKSK
jgi:thioredoxin-related protein